MAEIGLMIEGQDGTNWTRWRRLLDAAERLGFASVSRSDHFTNARPPDKDSLELWASLTYAASHTERIEFGPLVTPVTFRHPTITVWVVEPALMSRVAVSTKAEQLGPKMTHPCPGFLL